MRLFFLNSKVCLIENLDKNPSEIVGALATEYLGTSIRAEEQMAEKIYLAIVPM